MARWHPVEQARRTGADELTMVDPVMGAWGIIRRLTFGGEVWYRGVTFADDPVERALTGYSEDLRAIAKALYLHYLHTKSGAPVFPGYPEWRNVAG